MTAFEPGRAVLSTGETVQADALVVATGAEPAALSPELAVLSPIKGHILRFAPGGPLAGEATLRPAGLRHRRRGRPLRRRHHGGGAGGPLARSGEGRSPAPPGRSPVGPAGRRAVQGPGRGGGTTPDGLPLVGPSEREGVFLAAGARRNGWLLAPLVAQMTAAYLAGRDPGPETARLDPRRFASA